MNKKIKINKLKKSIESLDPFMKSEIERIVIGAAKSHLWFLENRKS